MAAQRSKRVAAQRSKRVAAQRSKRPASWRVWVLRLAPWVLTAAVIAWILRRHPVDQIAHEVTRGDALLVLPIAVGLTLVLVVLISVWDFLAIHGLLGRPRYRDVLRGKAGTSMLLTIGYGFGHGGYAVWIARVTGASVGHTAGLALYIAASDLCALALVATAAIYLGDTEVPRALMIVAPALGGGLLVLMLVSPLPWGRLAIFEPWGTISKPRQLIGLLGRVGNITLIVVGTWVGMRVFGLDIPLWVMAAYFPLIVLVGSLPINVAGFGPVQGVWLLFEPWAAGATILAFQFLWTLMLAAGFVLRGLPFIRQVIAEIADGSADPDPAD